MVDMTGRKAIGTPLPPPSPVKAKDNTDLGHIIAAGFCFVLSATVCGLGVQLEQWWLAAGGGAATVLFLWLAAVLEERLRKAVPKKEEAR